MTPMGCQVLRPSTIELLAAPVTRGFLHERGVPDTMPRDNNYGILTANTFAHALRLCQN